MKKLISILLAVAMVMALAVPTMAAEETDAIEPELRAHAYDMTYYVGGYGAVPNRYQCSVDYREQGYGYGDWFDISFGDPIVENWPTEAGTYTVTFEKTTKIEGAGDTEYTFNLSMNITVLELPATSGQCGDNMTWSFDTATDTLTISGTGDMYTIAASDEDFQTENYNYRPGWWDLPVKHIVIEEGVENLSNYAFTQSGICLYYEVLETIQLPTTLKAIPELGFLMSNAMTSLTIPEGITSITGWPFGYPGNSFLPLTDLYLPSTLTEMDIVTIILAGYTNKRPITQTLKTIHFAGTEEQWNAISRIRSETMQSIMPTDDETYALYEEMFNEITVVFEPKDAVQEEEMKVQLSDITIDELSGWLQEDGEGNTYRYYDWFSHGTVDALVGDTQYDNITFEMLYALLSRQYGDVYYSSGFIYEGDRNPNRQEENPWKPGDEFLMRLELFTDEELLFSGDVTIKVIETDIDYITAKPVTIYPRLGFGLELTSHYKDGTSGPCRLYDFYFVDDVPEELGSHTVRIMVADTFEVPVEVTVIPAPTSGKLGENVNWAYDEATKTLTVSGTGDTYFVDEDMANASEEYDEWHSSWANLMAHHMPKKVVVEEGITGLMPGFMLEAYGVEEFSLPNSLKNLPQLMLGYNGPSSDMDFGYGETAGVSAVIVPQSVKTWDELSFHYCWGVKDIYLPAGLTSVNLENLVYTSWLRSMIELEAMDVTIHFAGTEEQWNAINFFVPAEPSELTGSGTGLTLEEAKELLETVTVVFEDPSETYEKIFVDNGTVTVPDDIVEIEEGKDIVIDITTPGEEAPKVESVVIGSAIVDKIVEAETKVEIKLPEVTVSFDKAAIGSIGEQAADKDVTIVATEIKQEDLKTEQKAALEEKAVYTVLNLEAFAGDEKITEFGGGKVTVSVAFELPEGTIGTDFVVAYVADDGTITLMPTTYADGVLSFETTHFSNYVVLAVSDNPKTGDTTVSALVALLVLSGAACLTLCANKRRIF